MNLSAVDSSRGTGPRFRFGDYCLEPDGTLLRHQVPVHLPAKELAALRLLLQHAGHIVTPQQLRDTVWGDVHVTADSIPRCISSLRARLEAEDRIQTIYKQGYRLTGEVEKDVMSTAADPALLRLALVPFSCGPNVPEHMGQAVAEDATARLTALRPQIFSMLARDSAFTLADKGMSAQQVGEALQADLVLTGTVQILGRHFRLRMELIRIEDGTQIWVEDALVSRDRAAALQEMVVERLAFRSGVNVETPSSVPSGSDHHSRAFDTFLRGRYEWQSTEPHRMQDGLRYLHHAIELDPGLLQARVDIVRATVTQELLGYTAPRIAGQQVKHIAESLREHEDARAAILPALAWMKFHVDRDLTAAQSMFDCGINRPFDPWEARIRALFAASRHRFSEATGLLSAAVEKDPYSPWLNAELALVYHLSGKNGESMRQVARCLDLSPDHVAGRLYGGAILAFNGEAERAISLTKELAQQTPYFDMAIAVHAYALACNGDRNAAEDWLERLQWLSHERYVVRSFASPAYAALGDCECAMAELRAGDEDRCPWFFAMLSDPRLKPLHDLAEFQAMRAQLEAMECAATEIAEATPEPLPQ
ncbi:winged helix-turn-helix domain-containing protein [Occallatibacter riparius]|uniref:Winged helix-turn-helix domain-containing protein n=1 Tax=Occallatibacter riparius TaxID=1002689 RepID=A0A9J7BLF1_9BACT|nr:winged helix-turn-helix domain-containing protein [Occallatibacter riparius]UWZ82061.1 winged helix-turn-helix domain-containing protein [Occallatibacter riparius]